MRRERESEKKRQSRPNRLARRLSEQLELPLDAVTLLPHLECTGDQELTVDGHHGILEYSDSRIRLSGGRLIIVITGHALELTGMTADRARVSGEIHRIGFEH